VGDAFGSVATGGRRRLSPQLTGEATEIPAVATPLEMADWKAQLEEILTNRGLGRQALVAAHALKQEHIPRSLYKYRCPTKASFNMVKGRCVWLASPGTFNDPFDSAVTFDPNRIIEDIRADGVSPSLRRRSILVKLIQGEYPGIPPAMREALVKSATEWYATPFRWVVGRASRRLRSDLKVCCFSETMASLPMWAHYAGCHTGFCIRWDVSEWSSQPEILEKLFPVLYDEHPFQMPSLAVNPAYRGAELLLALRKAIDWSYEKEWRLVGWGATGEVGMSQQLPTPAALYIGALASKATKRKVSRLAAEIGAEVFQMHCDLERGCLMPHRMT
jgi:hypothetical protein